MHLTYRYLGLALALGLVSCGGDHSEASGDQGIDRPIGAPSSLSFEHQGALQLAPGEIADVVVTVKPAARYQVTFHLVGAALDASLDRTTVTADAGGTASVRVRAPNGTTTFVLRASVKDGPSADLAVAVSDRGFGTLAIEPVYTGNRGVVEWSASVMAGTSCADLASTFPADPDGALHAQAAYGTPLDIESAPVGPNLAVFVRAGFYAWGCADEQHLVAGERLAVSVPIVNKSLDLSQTELEVDFAVGADAAVWSQIARQAGARVLDSFCAGAPADALLGSMSEAATDPSAFDLASEQHGYPAIVEQHLEAGSVDVCASLEELVTEVAESPPTGLWGTLHSLPGASGQALFTLTDVGPVDAQSSGAPAEYLMSWTADPDDTVRLGGTLFWLPSRYVGTAMAAAALADDDGSLGSFLGVLMTLQQCASLAAELTPYEGCEAGCLEGLCVSALATRWEAALDASATAGDHGEITVEASGAASFDDAAVITGFEGMWIGSIESGGLTAKVQGVVVAGDPPAEIGGETE